MIGNCIRTRRAAAGLTQGELAKMVGVGSSAVANWENNTRTPDAYMLIDIAKALNCTIEDLFGEKAVKLDLLLETRKTAQIALLRMVVRMADPNRSAEEIAILGDTIHRLTDLLDNIDWQD